MRACRNLRLVRPHLSWHPLSNPGIELGAVTDWLRSRALFFFELTACRLFRGRRLSNLLRWTRRRRVWIGLTAASPSTKTDGKELGLSVHVGFLSSFHRALGPCGSDTLRAERSRKMKNAPAVVDHTSVEVVATPNARLSCTRWQSHSTKFLCLSCRDVVWWQDKARARKANKKKTKLGERRGVRSNLRTYVSYAPGTTTSKALFQFGCPRTSRLQLSFISFCEFSFVSFCQFRRKLVPHRVTRRTRNQAICFITRRQWRIRHMD